MKLVMFDVDGTLIDSLQVHLDCYPAAMMRVVDAKDFTMDWSIYPHITDSFVLHHHFMSSRGQPPQSTDINSFQEFFTNSLIDAFAKTPDRFRSVPGAGAFLEVLRQSSEYAIAIATGGWQRPVSFKLRTAGLLVEDLPRAFADDGHSREEIMQTVYCRACAHYACASFERVIYVGDGAHDVQASRNLAYDFVGVAEAGREERLRSVGAQHIAPDFTNVDGFMKLLAMADGCAHENNLRSISLLDT